MLHSKNIFCAPPMTKPPSYCGGVDPSYPRPLRTCFCDGHIGDVDVTSSVVGLLHWERPLAVVSRIPMIIVDSFNSVSAGWFKSHIGEKLEKAISPRLTHTYTSFPVVGIFGVGDVVTSSFYSAPYIIFNRLAKVMGGGRLFTERNSMASTRFGVSAFEFGRIYRSEVSAVTLTKPSSSAVFSIIGSGNNRETEKGFTFKVAGFHNILRRYCSEKKRGKPFGKRSFSLDNLATGAL